MISDIALEKGDEQDNIYTTQHNMTQHKNIQYMYYNGL